RGPAGLSRACRPRAGPWQRAQGGSPNRSRDVDAQDARARCGLLCRGKQLLRAALAGLLLGWQLRKTPGAEAKIRSGVRLLRPPWRRKRRLERRRFFEACDARLSQTHIELTAKHAFIAASERHRRGA